LVERLDVQELAVMASALDKVTVDVLLDDDPCGLA
jgi:hypothetical protein